MGRSRIVRLEPSVRDARILDNTLPLSAYDYFRSLQDKNHAVLDPYARQCFAHFVDAFINTPAAVILPHGSFVDADPFTTLWHSEPADVSVLPPSSMPAEERDALVTSFLNSVARRPNHWLGLIRLRWDFVVVQEFKRRAPRWRDEFAESLAVLIPALAKERWKYERTMTTLAARVDELDAANAIDAEYSDEAERRGVRLHEYALADALSWFLRGASYRGHAQHRAIKVHPLRLPAVDTSVTVHEVFDVGEVVWSRLLEDSLISGRLPGSDVELFVSLIEQLKRVTLTDQEFRYGLEEYRTGRQGEPYLREQLVLAASKAGMELRLKDDTIRKAIVTGIADTLDAVPLGLGKIVKPFACLVLQTLDSTPLHRIEAAVRLKTATRFGLKSGLWRTFNIVPTTRQLER